MDTITPKAGLKLRQIGSKYMIVEASDNRVNLTNVYSMNETAAWMWQAVGEGSHTPETLAEAMTQVYEVTPEQALADINRQLDTWKEMGLLV